MDPIAIPLYECQSLIIFFSFPSALMRDKLHILGISFWFQSSIIKLRDFLLNSGRMFFSKVQLHCHSSRSGRHLSYSIRTYVDVDLILVLPIVSHFLITFVCFSFRFLSTLKSYFTSPVTLKCKIDMLAFLFLSSFKCSSFIFNRLAERGFFYMSKSSFSFKPQ